MIPASSIAVTGDGSYDVATGATSKLGCYAPVEHLVLDSNQTVTASSVIAAQYTIFMAGVDPAVATKLAAFGIPTDTGNDNEQVIISLIVFAFLLLRVRHRRDRHRAPATAAGSSSQRTNASAPADSAVADQSGFKTFTEP